MIAILKYMGWDMRSLDAFEDISDLKYWLDTINKTADRNENNYNY